MVFELGLRFREYLPSSNKMSETPAVTDPVVPPVVPSAPTEPTTVTEAVPAPSVTVTPAPVVDFGDHGALLKLALTKIAEAQLQADVALDDKIKQIVEAIKGEIRKAELSPAVRMAAIDWCDDALPYVIRAVDMIQAEIKKAAVTEIAKVQEVALAEVKKCCPSFFTKKV